ncbi:membrane fusion protein, macrolide-specific efflux system [Tessaracoccus bendigoensis DSM 12906]|uniref:Membrane fusion protein, macrolide-specific efflux system n=1 Tax=Tessaracoccus bendigoensis DSM 12906 TaxID=1123357 RepID=A0A1M6JTV1_9ACTN|nr:biotin/lipoyl-binding protein [Tessaracoccus bendigoensis]SHJ50101.1 membrane fusion protein, macrolide-specific efflux system [Tessaracoccus bendigoensis DSM 12906]
MTDGASQPEAPPRRNRLGRPTTLKGRIVLVTALALVAAGGGTAAWLLTRPDEAPTATRQVVTISPTTLKTTVSASGTLEPQRQSDLSFGSSGTVTAVNVAVGDEVTEGEELARIDTSAVDIALRSAKADLTAAQESLSDLEDSDDATDAAINAAEASVKVKQNAVASAESDVAAATLTAPFAGVVAAVNVAVGDSSGSSSGGSGAGGSVGGGGGGATDTSTASGAITLISKDAFTVSTSVSSSDIASVSSSDIASVKRGLQAELTVSGSDETIYGTVESVAVVATSSTSGTSSFPVTIKVTGAPQGLFAGSSVTADIIVSQQADVIAVSAAALTTVDGASTVTKVVDGVDTVTPVTTGETVNGQVIVTEGLAEGDQIVVEITTPTGGSDGQGSGGTQGVPGQGNGQLPDFGSGGFSGAGMQPPDGQGGQQGGPNR